jgi:hypothetical protein
VDLTEARIGDLTEDPSEARIATAAPVLPSVVPKASAPAGARLDPPARVPTELPGPAASIATAVAGPWMPVEVPGLAPHVRPDRSR